MTASPTHISISSTLSPSLSLRTKQLDFDKSAQSSLSNISKLSFSNDSNSIVETTADKASVGKGKYLSSIMSSAALTGVSKETPLDHPTAWPRDDIAEPGDDLQGTNGNHITLPTLSPLPPELFLSKSYVWPKIKNFFGSIFFTQTGALSTVIIVTGSLALAGVFTISSLAPIVFFVTAMVFVSIGSLLLLRQLYKCLTTPFLYGGIDNEFSKNIQLMSKGSSIDKAPQDQVITKSDLRILSGIILQAHTGKMNFDRWQLITKNEHNCEHSFLVCGNNLKLDIIIKPKNHNSNFYHRYLKRGAFKTIKRGGIRIILNLDKFNYFADRIVTCSEILEEGKKLDLKKYLGEDLIKGGFEKIEFNDRALYCKKDLGANLKDWITGKSLNQLQKIDIVKELITKIKWKKTGDIKLKNITYDGKNAHYIDDTDMLFTYTTKDQQCGGDYSKFECKLDEFKKKFGVKFEDAIIKQQILGLTFVCFQLFNNFNPINASVTNQILGALNEKDTKLRNSPLSIQGIFSEELKKAYNGELTLKELKQKIENLKIADFESAG